MALTISRTWRVGEFDERDLAVCLPGRVDYDGKSHPWETIVIGAMASLPTADVWECRIDQVDDGGVIGPIHLPCTIHVPGARQIWVAPTGPVTADTTIAATAYCADHRGFRSFAIWSVVAVIGQVIPIPQWVRAVGCIDPATFVYLDRAGAVLSAALDSDNDRPHLAVSVRCVTAGVIAFYY
jgi:hypothetical protein